MTSLMFRKAIYCISCSELRSVISGGIILNAFSLKLTPSQPLKIWGEVRFDFKLKVNIIPLNGSIKLEWQIAQLHDSHAVNVE